MALTTKDLEAIRETITHTGELRIHLMTSRSGGTCKARLWHPQERSRRKAMFDARPRGFTPEQVAKLKSRFSAQEWKALTQRERTGLDPVLYSGLNKETP